MLKIIPFSSHVVLPWFLFKGSARILLFQSLKANMFCILWQIQRIRQCFERLWRGSVFQYKNYSIIITVIQRWKVIKHFGSRRCHMNLIIFMWVIIFQTNCSHDLIPPRKAGVYLQTNCLSCLFTVCFLTKQDGLWGVTTRAVTALAKSRLAFNPFLL